jgi:hypothetical protein
MPATHKDAIAAVEAFALDRDPPLTPAEAAAYAMGFLSGVKSWSVAFLLFILLSVLFPCPSVNVVDLSCFPPGATSGCQYPCSLGQY